MDQKRRLDLERYRRMKEKGRRSPRVSGTMMCGSAPESELYTHQKSSKSPQAYHLAVAPLSPEPSALSRNMVCGMLGSHEKRVEPSPPSLQEQARQRRANKIQSRSRDRYEPSAFKNDALETETVLITPSATATPNSSSSRLSRASPLNRLRQSEKRRTPVDPPQNNIHGLQTAETIRSMHIEDPKTPKIIGTIHEPIRLEDAEDFSFPQGSPPPPSTDRYKISPMSGVDEPNPATSAGNHASARSISSSSTERRDRIEESRDASDSDDRQTAGFRTPNTLDRIESIRGIPTAKSLDRHSLELPSLHSRYSSETPQPGLQNVYTPSQSSSFQQWDHPTRNGTLRQNQEENRQTLAKQFKNLSIDASSFRHPEEQVHIYRPESPSFTLPALDQKTVRILYSKEFQAMIEKRKEEIVGEQDENELPANSSSNRVCFVARKRPISKEEVSLGDFDVVNMGTSNTVVVYEATLKSDFRTKCLTPHPFRCDGVFSANHSSEEFYIRAGQSHVLTAKGGGTSAFVIFGCPSSGKTYTMTDIEERAAYDIFGSDDLVSGALPTVSVQYVELCGKQCFDLIGPVGNFVRVVESENGHFQFKGVMSKVASNANEMLTILSDAKRRLATQASIRKKSEGQTFIVCKMAIQHRGRRGTLTLVECSADRGASQLGQAKDTPDSTSFDHLIECLTSKAARRNGAVISELSSNAAKILKETLQDPNSRVCVVATISPGASTTESTLSTLGTVARMTSKSAHERGDKEQQSPCNEAEDLTLPRQWNHAELINFMGKKNLLSNPVPPEVNGRFAMRMSKMQLKNTFYDVMDDAKAEKLYAALRAENDRIARIRVKRRIARDLHQSN